MKINKNSKIYKELGITEITQQNAIMGNKIFNITFSDGVKESFTPKK